MRCGPSRPRRVQLSRTLVLLWLGSPRYVHELYTAVFTRDDDCLTRLALS